MIRGSYKNSYFPLVFQIQKFLYKIISNLKQIIIQWIPSHNIHQNDLVDQIVKNACFYLTSTSLSLEFEE